MPEAFVGSELRGFRVQPESFQAISPGLSARIRWDTSFHAVFCTERWRGGERSAGGASCARGGRVEIRSVESNGPRVAGFDHGAVVFEEADWERPREGGEVNGRQEEIPGAKME